MILSNQSKEPVKSDKEIVQQQKKLKYQYSSKLKKGHKFFKLNLKTGEVTEAKVEHFIVSDGKGGTQCKGKIVREKFCEYMPALNKKNAIKRFKKVGWLR